MWRRLRVTATRAQLDHVSSALATGNATLVGESLSLFTSTLDQGAASLASEALNLFLSHHRTSEVRHIFDRYMSVPGVQARLACLILESDPHNPSPAVVDNLVSLLDDDCTEAFSVMRRFFVDRRRFFDTVAAKAPQHIPAMRNFFRTQLEVDMSGRKLHPKLAAAVLFDADGTFADDQKLKLAERCLRDETCAGDACLYLGRLAEGRFDYDVASNYYFLGQLRSPECTVNLARLYLSCSTSPFVDSWRMLGKSPWTLLQYAGLGQANYHLAMDVIVSAGKVPFDGTVVNAVDLLKEAGSLGHKEAIREYAKRITKP